MINILFGLAGLVIGSKLPDIDLAPVLFLKHRSAWTHGPLMPALVLWLAYHWPWLTPAAIGILSGLCLHLLADSFPKSWHGSAFVNLAPLPGSLPALWSFALMALTSGLSLLLAVQLAGGWETVVNAVTQIRF